MPAQAGARVQVEPVGDVPPAALRDHQPGSAEPLVVASAPPHLLGRPLARWQLSYGLARAVDPMIITALLTVGAAALWVPLAVATLAGATVVALATRSGAALSEPFSDIATSTGRSGA